MARRDCRPLFPLSPKDIERFWSKIDRRGEDECWLWKGCTTRHGYGAFGYGPPKQQRMFRANRIAYFLGHGRDPSPFCVLHKCDNPPCCNPIHYFLGSRADNVQDATAKGRMQSGENHYMRRHPELIVRGESHYSRKHPEFVLRGERRHNAKLGESDVVEIRTLYRTGSYGQEALAAMFGVTKGNVSQIIRRKTWTHV